MGSAQKIANGAIWSVLLNIINAIYGFISVPILIDYFGKSEYGLIGLAMSINVYMQLMDMGFNSTNVRFFSNWLAKKELNKTSALFQTSLVLYGCIGLINAFILLLISFFSESIFDVSVEQNQILRNLLYILAINAFISWYSSCFDQLIKATENVGWVQKRSIIPKILQIIILIITVYAGLSITLYFFLTTFAVFAVLPLSVHKIRLETPFIRFCPKINKEIFRAILPYSLAIFSFSIFQFSFYNLRPIFLGIQGTLESVADYRVLNGITGIVSMIGGTFLQVLLPSSSKVVAENNKSAYYQIAYQGTKYISIILCFCAFGMMTVGEEIITLYVGQSYLYLIPWLNLWLLCTLGVHNQAISSLILAGSNIKSITLNSTMASIIGLLVSWFLIPIFQIGGVVIAYAVYLCFQLGFYYFYYWPKKMDINSHRVFFKSFLPYLICGSAIYLIISRFTWINHPIISLLLKGFIYSVIYSIFCIFTIKKSEKKYLISLISMK